MHRVDTTTLGPLRSRTFMIASRKSICLLSRPATNSSGPRKKIGQGPIFCRGRCRVGSWSVSPAAPVKPNDTEDAMSHGIFVWNELYTRDVESAKAFYAATVGWTFEGMPMPDRDRTYWIAK